MPNSKYLGKYPIFANFSLSFTVKPIAKVGALSNLLHFSMTDGKYDQMPSVFVLGGMTAPRFEFGDWSLDGPQLSRVKLTDVKLVVFGSVVQLFYGGQLIKQKTYGGPVRATGAAHVYASR